MIIGQVITRRRLRGLLFWTVSSSGCSRPSGCGRVCLHSPAGACQQGSVKMAPSGLKALANESKFDLISQYDL